jgi:hypothetical protein
MKPLHGISLILVLIFAYLLGVKFPTVGASVLSKIPGMS